MGTVDVSANDGDAVLAGFFPITVLARVCGYFPFSNVGASRRMKAEELSAKKLRVDIIVFIMVLVIMVENSVYHMNHWDNPVVNYFKVQFLAIYFIGYRLFSTVIIIHLSVFRSRKMVTFLKNICDTYAVLKVDRRRSLRILGYSLTAMIIITQFIFITCYVNEEHFTKTWFEASTYYVVSTTLFAFNFVGVFVIYFTCILGWCFDSLRQSLIDVLSTSDDLPLKLASIRQRHEHLMSLVENMNSLLSPILTLYVLGQSVSICANLYDFCFNYVQKNSLEYLVMTNLYYLIRLVPLVIVFTTSSTMSRKAKSLVGPLHASQLMKLPRKSKFQINLMLKHLECRKANLSANDILDIDNHVLAEIFGAIITYNVIMMEMSVIREKG